MRPSLPHPGASSAGKVAVVATAVVSWARRLRAAGSSPRAPRTTASTGAGVDEAREAETRRQRAEERARSVIDSCADAFVAIDATGMVAEWNSQAERVFGWRREEVLGRALADTIVPPSLRQAHLEGLRRVVATGEGRVLGQSLELDALHRDGHLFPVELSLSPVCHGGRWTFNAFIRDITKRRERAEAAQRLAAIVESSQDAIVSTDLEGLIQTWNGAAGAMYGYEAAEAIGRPMSLIVPAERRHEVEHLLDEVRRGVRVPHHETTQLTKSGMTLEVALTLSPVRDASGSVVGASAVARDISEQRWLAATLDTTLSSLEAALAEARLSAQTSRRFLADAAHQLRTPLGGIRAAAETLLHDLPPTSRDRLLADLIAEASRAGRLVARLLQVARLDQGEALAPEPVDVVALCHEEAKRARAHSPDLHIGVRTTAPLQPCELDPHAVREILANLLDNARRHARHRIELVVGTEDDTVAVAVVDDGPGLPMELVERAFERFASLDGMGGSGLGLPIASGLAEAHGGELRYESRRFILRLPMTVEKVRAAAR